MLEEKIEEFKCTNCKFRCIWKGKLACKNTANNEPDEIKNEDEICSDYERSGEFLNRI